METSGPTSGIPRLPATTSPSTTVQWQTGQLLQATVSESSAGKVLLAIGNRQVSAETSLLLEKGQHLTLQVRSLGERPVLNITSAPGESPTAAAVRLLLPKHGSMTPLLANISMLARTPNPPIPALINEMVRSTVRQLPDIPTASTPQGLKKAVAESGIYLERQLLQSSSQPDHPLSVRSDFKANLLRLVQLVRHWPGSSGQSSASRPAPATGSAAGSGGVSAPTGAAQASPAGGTPAAPAPPTATQATTTHRNPPVSPDQIRRTVQSGLPDKSAPAARAAPNPALPGAVSTAAGTGASTPSVVSAASPPPPFPGSVPLPQAAVQAGTDLLNRLGHLRTDLLQQTEAALARIQLQQLAALPREGERGLLEWLFELPVRRGDDIDVWSMRIFRDPRENTQEKSKPAPNWSVQLAFDLPGLGPVQVQVQLTGERISSRFWTEQHETLPLIRGHLPELRQALNEAGLEVGELECRPGSMPAAKSDGHQPFINEKV